MSIKEFERRLEDNLSKLHEQLAGGTYEPQSIRRVYLDKPGQVEKRPLGIPTVRDRVVQTAIKLVIEPIFERESEESSFGFCPGQGCHDAIRRVEECLNSGGVHVVDADFREFFESLDHELLAKRLEERISDGRLLELIGKFLRQDVMEPMGQWTPDKGAPQGSVLSPVLANVLLHPLDVQVAEA